MRHRLKHLSLFLVLGAVMNYALAMGIIWFGPLSYGKPENFLFHRALVSRVESVGMTRIVWSPVEARGDPYKPGEPPAWSGIHRYPRPFMNWDEWRALPQRREFEDVAAGWPLRSVRYHFETLWRHPAGDEIIIRSGIGLPPRQLSYSSRTSRYTRAIPLRAIPLGSAINTALFGSLAAIVWLGPSTIRRRRRRRGNHCLKCGS
jgi:hypothetical protein